MSVFAFRSGVFLSFYFRFHPRHTSLPQGFSSISHSTSFQPLFGRFHLLPRAPSKRKVLLIPFVLSTSTSLLPSFSEGPSIRLSFPGNFVNF